MQKKWSNQHYSPYSCNTWWGILLQWRRQQISVLQIGWVGVHIRSWGTRRGSSIHLVSLPLSLHIEKCSTSAGYLPIVPLHNLQDPLLHIFKWNWLHVGICRTSLFRCWSSKVVHHLLQFKQEVVLKLRPLNPRRSGNKAQHICHHTSEYRKNCQTWSKVYNGWILHRLWQHFVQEETRNGYSDIKNGQQPQKKIFLQTLYKIIPGLHIHKMYEYTHSPFKYSLKKQNVCLRVCAVRSYEGELIRPEMLTYMVSPVLAIWHRNCSSRGHASFFAFLSKSEETKNHGVNNVKHTWTSHYVLAWAEMNRLWFSWPLLSYRFDNSAIEHGCFGHLHCFPTWANWMKLLSRSLITLFLINVSYLHNVALAS